MTDKVIVGNVGRFRFAREASEYSNRTVQESINEERLDKKMMENKTETKIENKTEKETENKTVYEFKTVVTGYDYKEQWMEGMEYFGWKLVERRPAVEKTEDGFARLLLLPFVIFPGTAISDRLNGCESKDKVELRFKRDKNIPKKNELNRLQRNFENTMKEMERMEKNKFLPAYVGGGVCGLIGAVFAAGGVFAMQAGSGLGAGMAFGIPGLAVWMIGFALYLHLKKKRTETIEDRCVAKEAEAYEICRQAWAL